MSKHRKFDFEKIRDRAKELRINMTVSEELLWKELRDRKLSGFKFLRQHVILYKGNLKKYNYFVADFYCYEKKVVIELDGPVHEKTERYDEFRDSELQELGLRVLRIKNEELDNMAEVLSRIRLFLTQSN